MVELYDWQKKAIAAYDGKGTVKAVTGAGKTLVGKEIAKKIGGRTVVTAPYKVVLGQWKGVMSDVPNVQYMTFNKASKTKTDANLLIVDDAHRSTSPEFSKLYDNIRHKNILCLTAVPTPEVLERCGDPICDVSYDEANISPFTVTFHGINLTPFEQDKYNELSQKIAALMSMKGKKKIDNALDTVIRQRRDLVYNARNRLPYAEELIRMEYDKGRKILVISQRIEQAEAISERIKDLPHIVFHSKNMGELEKYRNGNARICISVGMLREGFDDPNTDVGIIVSTTLSEDFNKQTIGRIIRFAPHKHADVHILLAKDTTDEEVLKYAYEYEHRFVNITPPYREAKPVMTNGLEMELIDELKNRVRERFAPMQTAIAGVLVLAGVVGLMFLLRKNK